MNFGIGPSLFKDQGSGFSESPGPGPGPLYKICQSEGYVGAILMDLSKALDTINHDRQTACLWIFKGVFKINKKLLK